MIEPYSPPDFTPWCKNAKQAGCSCGYTLKGIKAVGDIQKWKVMA